MIPILYEGNETNFTSNGLGRLADAISCKVVEERNATYELEMTYPVSGIHYSDIVENRIILAQPFDGGQTQPFIIYKVTKPLNGIVTVNAEHISYRLSGMAVMPFTANTPTAALQGLKTYSAVTNPFNFSTDKTNTGAFTVSVPTSARELLCGSRGSILDVYGKGDYEFDRFNVFLRVNRGADNHVTIRYGKNLTDLKSVLDTTGVYTGIAPYWSDGQGNVVTLPEKVILSEHTTDFPYKIIKSVDFSDRWESAPTVADLRSAAQTYVTNNEGWKITNNVNVSFVALWNTEEYKEIAPLERVKMCDIVHIVYPKLGVNFSTKVIKTDFNVLEEKYNSITLGDTYYTLSSVFSEEIEAAQEEQTSHMQNAIAHATKLITGGLGGHVVFNLNADGEPQEILIMDTDSIGTATNVIRMNMNGIGFSTHGYNGPFTTAWTIDGHFVADFIDTGTLNADLIKAGLLQDETGLNYWNMVTGDFRLTSGARIGNSNIASTDDVANGDASTLNSAEDYADNGITLYDVALNQVKVFNKLTNNGAAKGIYMTNNQLYINADYVATGIITDIKGYNFWNLNTGEFQLRQGAKIGNSTVASAADVSSSASSTLDSAEAYADGAVTIYDNDLNQLKVFNKLTRNGQAKGIYMTGNELYINGTYIKTGTLDASLIKAGIIQDKKQYNYWNMVTGEFRLSPTYTTVEGSPLANKNDITGAKDYAKTYTDDAIDDYDDDLNQQAVFNKLTNNGRVEGIYLQDGNLYINGTYIQTGTIDASKATITKLNASNITTGTLSAARIASHSIAVGKLSGTIQNGDWKINLNDGTMTIGTLSANSLTAGTIDASVITVTNINASNITSGSINASNVSISNLSADSITGGKLTISTSGRATAIEVYNGNRELMKINPSDGLVVSGSSTKVFITGSGLAVGTSNATYSSSGVKIQGDQFDGYVQVGYNSNNRTDIKNGQVVITNNTYSNYGLSVSSSSNGINISASSSSNNYALSVNQGKTILKETTIASSSSYNNALEVTTGKTVLKDTSITGTSSSAALNVKAYSSSYLALNVESGYAQLPEIHGAIYAKSDKLGFFGGDTNSSRQRVNKLSSNASTSDIVSRFNDLLTALKSYNLIDSW